MPSTSIDCTVKVGTKELSGDEVHDVLVELDLDQPDHSIITLSNLSTKYSETVTEGDELEVKLGFVDGKDQATVFKGEVVGIEPIYAANAPARVHIRGLNQLHRLMRGKKSVSFVNVTDKDIVDKLCQNYGLSAEYGDTPPSTKYSEQVNEGDELEVKLGFVDGHEQGTVFKGEVVGIEAIYAANAPARVHIRGYNQLHRLMRGKKSVTYTKMTDKDIVDKLCQQYGLSADYGSAPPTTQYEHVYQHNLTDLEFLRMRAARLGFEVAVDDKKLFFRKRVDQDSGIKLVFGVSGPTLERFLPRLSTAQQVSEVRVFGWDPVNKKEIVGSAQPQSSKLGDKHGSAVADAKHKNVLQVVHESPVSSKEEADNIAKSILNDRMMDFITGDGVCRGNPDLKPGIIVTINVQDKRFDGKYHLTSVRHRYVHAGHAGGYRTEFKFRRDAKSESS